MKSIQQMVNELQATTSKNSKKDIVKKYKEIDECKKFLHFLLNDYITTGISNKKLAKKLTATTSNELVLTDLDSLMKYLNGNTGTDASLRVIHNFANGYENGLYKDLIYGIAGKSIKLGMSADSVNEVIPGLIPVFGCILAKAYNSKEDKKIKGDIFLTSKLDGNRMICRIDKEDIKFYTRAGQEIEGLTEIKNDLLTCFKGTARGVFDGEVLLENPDNLPTDELFRITQKIIKTKGNKTGLVFHIFDVIELDEFDSGNFTKKYSIRRKFLDSLEISFKNHKTLKIVPLLYSGLDKSKIAEWSAWAEKMELEGIMINLDAPYSTKRTSNLLKVKKFHTLDLKVIDVEIAESGKYKGKVGALVVDYKGYEVGVGSGLSDVQREEWARNPRSVINRVIEIGYFEESKNQDGGISLRFPTFKYLREEGKEVSYN